IAPAQAPDSPTISDAKPQTPDGTHPENLFEKPPRQQPSEGCGFAHELSLGPAVPGTDILVVKFTENPSGLIGNSSRGLDPQTEMLPTRPKPAFVGH
ncbi:MAG: hypothetical protein AB7O66_14410, partial [Limisphaerales bacterium]